VSCVVIPIGLGAGGDGKTSTPCETSSGVAMRGIQSCSEEGGSSEWLCETMSMEGAGAGVDSDSESPKARGGDMSAETSDAREMAGESNSEDDGTCSTGRQRGEPEGGDSERRGKTSFRVGTSVRGCIGSASSDGRVVDEGVGDACSGVEDMDGSARMSSIHEDARDAVDGGGEEIDGNGLDRAIDAGSGWG
jgi:hypothetical protein